MNTDQDAPRRRILFPRQLNERYGWTIDFKFLQSVQDVVIRLGAVMPMKEDIENILLEIERVMPAPTGRSDEEIRARLKSARLEVEDEASQYNPTAAELIAAEAKVAELEWVLGERE